VPNKMLRLVPFLVLALLAAACHGKGGATEPKAGGSGSAAPVDILDKVPADTAMVIHLDVRRLLTSRLWERFGAEVTKVPEVSKTIAFLKASCDFDLMKDLHEIDVAVPRSLDEDAVVFLLRGNLDRDTFTRCIRAAIKQNGEPEPTVRSHGRFTEVQTAKEKGVFGWAADDTLVVSVKGMQGGAAALAWLDDGARKPSPELRALRARMKSDQMFSGIVLVSGKMGEQVASAMPGQAPAAMWFNIAQDKGLNAELGLTYADEQGAKEMAGTAQKAFAELGEQPETARYKNMLHATAQGRDVQMLLDMDAESFDAIVNQLMTALPALMQMLGK